MVERQITRAMLRRAAVNGYRQVRAMPRAVRLTSGQANHIRRAMGLRERTEP